MGQYYTPVIQAESGLHSFCAYRFDNGLKLTEHAWVGNNFVAAVLNYVHHQEGARLWWLGDYAEPRDFENKLVKFDSGQLKKIFADQYDCNDGIDEHYKCYVVVNVDKHEYIDLLDYNPGELCPIPLLTAVGNGRGGGDFWGENEEEVGSWAGDLIQCLDDLPEELEKELKKKVVHFKEVGE